MRKLLLILFVVVVMNACAEREYAVDDAIVEMNWNSAVKDLYMMEYDTTLEKVKGSDLSLSK